MLYLIAAQLSKLAIQNVQQARVIIEREHANIKLVRINNLYKVANSINQNTSKMQTLDDLFQIVCDTLISEGDYQFAWIGLKNEKNRLSIAAYSGMEKPDWDLCQFEIDASAEKFSPIGFVFNQENTFCINRLDSYQPNSIWKSKALINGYKSVICLPIKMDSSVMGGLVIYSSEVDGFHDETVHLLEEIAVTVSLTLDSLEEEKRRKIAEKALISS
jgi:transcriptional regulator with GAF, ATPase, and Fis domain